MKEIKIVKVWRKIYRVKVVRHDFEMEWPYWADFEPFYRRPSGKKSLLVVYAGDQPMGFALPKTKYPRLIAILHLVMDNGREFRLLSRPLPVIDARATWVAHHLHKRMPVAWWYKNATSRPSQATYRTFLHCGIKLTYRTAQHVTVGQVVYEEQPFRLDLQLQHRSGIGAVTNGEIHFPLQRPFGHEWSRWWNIAFSQKIKDENWYTFLKAIMGLYMDEVLQVRRVQKRMEIIRRGGQPPRIVPPGKCFVGRGTAKRVAIGENLIFIIPSPDRDSETYLVDSPEYGRACYIFDTYDDAHAWASRAIDRDEARRRARQFIVHAGAWEERVNAAI